MTLADPDLEPRSSLEQEMGPQSNTMKSEVVLASMCAFSLETFKLFLKCTKMPHTRIHADHHDQLSGISDNAPGLHNYLRSIH